MRTFIAVPLPEKARSSLTEAQARLRSFGADVQWTRIESIHLTLQFLGEIDPAVVPRLATLLHEAAAPLPPITLRLNGLGVFPDFRNPRVIWCGLEGDLTLLSALQSRVDEACQRVGCSPEKRPFRPHLTLGRVRGKSNLQPLADYIRIGCISECEFEAGKFNIYRSVLKPQGAVYTILEEVALQGEKQP
jgi:RNA 2',3'-cyclic 3'-phosphodiesterase